MTPIMHARGKWELLDPYRTLIKDDVSYTCNGINDFGKVLAEGINIFEAYYKPYGLTLEQYNSDRVNGTSLVTLKSDDYADVLVPTTYIKVAPTTVTSGFSRMVMGLDVGVIPDTLDLTYVQEEVKELFTALTGLTDITVTMYTAPMTGILTPEQAASFEANRLAAVENRQTFFAKVEDLQRQLNTEKSIRQRYEQLIIQAGIPV
jgi:hypothetical protein